MAESAPVKALQDKRASLEDDRTLAQAKIAALQGEIDTLNTQIATINSSINEIDSTLNALNAVPSLDEVTPDYFTIELTSAPTLAVRGSGYVNGTTEILLNGSAQSTTVSDANNATCTVPLSLLAETGSFTVAVRNPAPGGGTSVSQTLQVVYAVPTISNISPSSIASGSGDTVITLTGTEYTEESVVLLNGSSVSTTFNSETEVEATIPTASLVAAGSITVAVQNPTPGGGSSDVSVVTVT